MSRQFSRYESPPHLSENSQRPPSSSSSGSESPEARRHSSSRSRSKSWSPSRSRPSPTPNVRPFSQQRSSSSGSRHHRRSPSAGNGRYRRRPWRSPSPGYRNRSPSPRRRRPSGRSRSPRMSPQRRSPSPTFRYRRSRRSPSSPPRRSSPPLRRDNSPPRRPFSPRRSPPPRRVSPSPPRHPRIREDFEPTAGPSGSRRSPHRHSPPPPRKFNRTGGRDYPKKPPPIGRYNSRRERPDSPVKTDFECKHCGLLIYGQKRYAEHHQHRARNNNTCPPPKKCKKCHTEMPDYMLEDHMSQCSGKLKRPTTPPLSRGSSSLSPSPPPRPVPSPPPRSAEVKSERRPNPIPLVAGSGDVPDVITLDDSDMDISNEESSPRLSGILQEAAVTSSEVVSPSSPAASPPRGGCPSPLPVSPPHASNMSPPRAIQNSIEGSPVWVVESPEYDPANPRFNPFDQRHIPVPPLDLPLPVPTVNLPNPVPPLDLPLPVPLQDVSQPLPSQDLPQPVPLKDVPQPVPPQVRLRLAPIASLLETPTAPSPTTVWPLEKISLPKSTSQAPLLKSPSTDIDRSILTLNAVTLLDKPKDPRLDRLKHGITSPISPETTLPVQRSNISPMYPDLTIPPPQIRKPTDSRLERSKQSTAQSFSPMSPDQRSPGQSLERAAISDDINLSIPPPQIRKLKDSRIDRSKQNNPQSISPSSPGQSSPGIMKSPQINDNITPPILPAILRKFRDPRLAKSKQSTAQSLSPISPDQSSPGQTLSSPQTSEPPSLPVQNTLQRKIDTSKYIKRKATQPSNKPTSEAPKRLPASLLACEEPVKGPISKSARIVEKHKDDQSKLDDLFDKKKRLAPPSRPKTSAESSSSLVKLVTKKLSPPSKSNLETRKVPLPGYKKHVKVIAALPMKVDVEKKKDDVKRMSKESEKNKGGSKALAETSSKKNERVKLGSKESPLHSKTDKTDKPKSFEDALVIDDKTLYKKGDKKKERKSIREEVSKNEGLERKRDDERKKGKKTKPISSYYTGGKEKSKTLEETNKVASKSKDFKEKKIQTKVIKVINDSNVVDKQKLEKSNDQIRKNIQNAVTKTLKRKSDHPMSVIDEKKQQVDEQIEHVVSVIDQEKQKVDEQPVESSGGKVIESPANDSFANLLCSEDKEQTSIEESQAITTKLTQKTHFEKNDCTSTSDKLKEKPKTSTQVNDISDSTPNERVAVSAQSIPSSNHEVVSLQNPPQDTTENISTSSSNLLTNPLDSVDNHVMAEEMEEVGEEVDNLARRDKIVKVLTRTDKIEEAMEIQDLPESTNDDVGKDSTDVEDTNDVSDSDCIEIEQENPIPPTKESVINKLLERNKKLGAEGKLISLKEFFGSDTEDEDDLPESTFDDVGKDSTDVEDTNDVSDSDCIEIEQENHIPPTKESIINKLLETNQKLGSEGKLISLKEFFGSDTEDEDVSDNDDEEYEYVLHKAFDNWQKCRNCGNSFDPYGGTVNVVTGDEIHNCEHCDRATKVISNEPPPFRNTTSRTCPKINSRKTDFWTGKVIPSKPDWQPSDIGKTISRHCNESSTGTLLNIKCNCR